MRRLVLHASSTNKKSLQNFKNLISSLIKQSPEIKISVTNTRSITKKLSILKSPHVNKTAQEQFETKYYRSYIIIKTSCYINTLITLKKLVRELFQDISLRLKAEIQVKSKKTLTRLKKENKLKPVNVKYPTSNNIKNKNIESLINYYKIIGELLLKIV